MRNLSIVTSTISYFCSLSGIDKDRQAKIMGISRRTLSDRMKDPGEIKIGELNMLAEAIGVPVEKFLREVTI